MFKIGDRVRCIDVDLAIKKDAGGYAEIFEGNIYTITQVDDIFNKIRLETGCYNNDWFHASRFELVEPQFKRGDRVLVYDSCGTTYGEKIFIAYIEGAKRPFMCVDWSSEDKFNNGERFGIVDYAQAKPIPTNKTVTLELTDEQLEKIRGIIG